MLDPRTKVWRGPSTLGDVNSITVMYRCTDIAAQRTWNCSFDKDLRSSTLKSLSSFPTFFNCEALHVFTSFHCSFSLAIMALAWGIVKSFFTSESMALVTYMYDWKKRRTLVQNSIFVFSFFRYSHVWMGYILKIFYELYYMYIHVQNCCNEWIKFILCFMFYIFPNFRGPLIITLLFVTFQN